MAIKLKLENDSFIEVASDDYVPEKIERGQHLKFRKKDDWRLPSIKELELIYNSIHKKDKGNFRNDWYWSHESFYVSWDLSIDMAYNFNDGTTNAEVLGNGATRSFLLSQAYMRLVRTV